MKSSGRFFSIVILFLVCLMAAQRTYACECPQQPPVYEAFDEMGAVFVGKVVGSNEPKAGESYDGRSIVFDLEVIENFKGASGKLVKMNLGSKSHMCYSGYEVGRTYLVYGSRGKNTHDNGELIFDDFMCSWTDYLDNARGQLYFIREKLKGKPQPQIYGTVKGYRRDTRKSPSRGTAEIRVKCVLSVEPV